MPSQSSLINFLPEETFPINILRQGDLSMKRSLVSLPISLLTVVGDDKWPIGTVFQKEAQKVLPHVTAGVEI